MCVSRPGASARGFACLRILVDVLFRGRLQLSRSAARSDMNTRVIKPEWLDTLPANEPGAMRSRADLRRVNWFMNNAGIVANALRHLAPKVVLDLGAGDGSFAARIVKRLGWQNVECVLLDRSAIVPSTVRDQFQSMH